jgi:hypothetical protein
VLSVQRVTSIAALPFDHSGPSGCGSHVDAGAAMAARAANSVTKGTTYSPEMP